ncbi:limonene-1,2-epoxide hydrolase family protein [Aeromicrobium terrae]|uniref:Epoxide hydrolase n=1 Tax=Aeromicrobium terrae TaxID=2498846 RepID=A0A5C8NNQ3_9ACTN|nr:limonene-1,2-epoxide hydrolase family protein [Aeromicrobium terrae]TXL62103.1 epoxide hydrolase [Aeromicrobium terrae]
MTEPTKPEGNAAVVTEFLDALAAPDTDRALSLLAPDIEWRNTGLPTFRGGRVFAMLRDMEKRGVGFAVDVHAIAEQGDVVLTDRTDYLWKGRLKTGFWVRGTFTVRDGLITVWDDAFSLGNLLKGFVKH